MNGNQEEKEYNEAYLYCLGNMLTTMCEAINMPKEIIDSMSWNKNKK